ncbi:MAG: methyltransferase domain-containing protein [bacterium]|nr:methyltransferase domain-containing protein [bacterium]
MIGLLQRLADKRRPDSIATRLRRRRFRLFHELLSTVNKKPLRVLDVGATIGCWATLDYLHRNRGVELTLLNLDKMESPSPHVATVVGDARDLKAFRDGQFDFVFSNSVIEHVGDFAEQKRMADEVRRVGNGYFVQTPNLYFPLEPHFLFPCFQFLPLCVKAFLLNHFRLGWHGPTRNALKARQTAASVRLLRRSELARLFPDGRIVEERFLGLVKSFIVFKPASIGGQIPTRGSDVAQASPPAFRSRRYA